MRKSEYPFREMWQTWKSTHTSVVEKYPENTDRFKILPGLPGKIIRTETCFPLPLWAQFRKSGSETVTHHRVNQVIAGVRRAQSIFDKLQDKYGIHIPAVHHVIGNRNNDCFDLITISDEIYGEKLSDMKAFPPESVPKLNSLCQGFSRYYTDVFLNGGDYFLDFVPYQITYGHKYGETANEFYMIDTDSLRGFDDHHTKNLLGFSFSGISLARKFRFLLELIERSSAQGLNLSPARQTLLESVEIMSGFAQEAHQSSKDQSPFDLTEATLTEMRSRLENLKPTGR